MINECGGNGTSVYTYMYRHMADCSNYAWHLPEVAMAVLHVCVCNYKGGCVFVPLQFFLPLQQALSRLHAPGQQTAYQCVHLVERLPPVSCVRQIRLLIQFCCMSQCICLFVCLFSKCVCLQHVHAVVRVLVFV